MQKEEERALAPGTLLLNPCQSEIDEISENKQKGGKREGASKFTFARFKDNCRRQHASLAANISTHHHGRADLRDHGAESGHEGSQKRQARLSPQVPDHLSA